MEKITTPFPLVIHIVNKRPLQNQLLNLHPSTQQLPGSTSPMVERGPLNMRDYPTSHSAVASPPFFSDQPSSGFSSYMTTL